MRAEDSRFLQMHIGIRNSIDGGGEKYLESGRERLNIAEKTEMDDVTILG